MALTAILNWFEANGDYGMQVVVFNFSDADYEIHKKVIDNAKKTGNIAEQRAIRVIV